MLVPVQTSGRKPPLFLVHGVHGVATMPWLFAPVLGPDQPVYAIHADGIDGERPVRDNLRDMVLAYAGEIHAARPMGPLLVAGICVSSMAAIDIARELQQRGRAVGPVIMLDPTPWPPGLKEQTRAVNLSEPQVARRLYEQSRRGLLKLGSSQFLPFDRTDPHQLHLATLAAVGSTIAFTKHVPTPFSAPTAVILSTQHAPGFFHPQMPWSKLISAPSMVHILPYDHFELLGQGDKSIASTLKFMLEEIAALDAAERGTVRWHHRPESICRDGSNVRINRV